eukprot:1001674-Lingulodinium_polyedra.AAC.1
MDQAIQATKTAGVPEDTLAVTDRETAEAWKIAADTRPLGARLDSTRAEFALAERHLANPEAA